MVKLEHIVCAVDFSNSSALALDYACQLALAHGAQLTVIHVLVDVSADGYPYIPESIYPDDAARKRAQDELEAFAAANVPSELSTSTVLGEGPVVDGILDASKARRADLIVVGTEGRKGVSRLLLGSVTERLLRQSDRPVLSVSPRAAAASDKTDVFRSVLCPVDFSPPSLEAFRYALAVAGDGGDVTLLHAIELIPDAALGDAIGFDIGKLREHHLADAQSKLSDAVPETAKDRTKIKTVSTTSRGAYREILDEAERESHDLIVMGVSGRSSADLFFFGSTANHVVREASCPVLTVRPSKPVGKLSA